MTKRRRQGAEEGAAERPRPLSINGYTLLVWSDYADRWRNLRSEVERLRANDTVEYVHAPAAKMLVAVRDAVLRDIPANPADDRFRQGNTMGQPYSHWRRAKLFGRYRLFFRYSSKIRVIVYAWLNDDTTLRKRGARTDVYTVFRTMLENGKPPDDWDALIRECDVWSEQDVR